MNYFHGGIAGLDRGDVLRPAPPHVSDGCPVCVARAEGRTCTVREFRSWLSMQMLRNPAHAATVRQALDMLADAPPSAPVDPPTGQGDRVYVAAEIEFARWYAARSGHGDLYRVEPHPPVEPVMGEDSGWTVFTAPAATVVEVVERRVHLTDAERAALFEEWGRRDRAAGLVP